MGRNLRGNRRTRLKSWFGRRWAVRQLRSRLEGHRRKAAIYTGALVVILFLTLYINAVANNQEFPYLYTPSKTLPVPFVLYYQENRSQIAIQMSFKLIANQTIGVGVPVRISDLTAVVYEGNCSKVVAVWVGFDGASWYGASPVPTSPGWVTIAPNWAGVFTGDSGNRCVLVPTSPDYSMIFFPQPKSYDPSITIIWGTGKPSQKVYPDSSLTVVSGAEIRAEDSNRINLALTVALVVFAVAEVLNIAREWAKEEQRTPTSTQSAPAPQPTPEQNQKSSHKH